MGSSAANFKDSVGPAQAERLTIAKAWIKANAAPVEAFPSLDLFASGAWNILLILYVSMYEHVIIDTKAACDRSGAAQTTALRYIAAMANAGLLLRLGDPLDGRRTLLQLSQLGIDGVQRAIDSASDSDQKLGLGRLVVVEDIERQL